MKKKLIEAPQHEPVTLDEAKKQCEIDDDISTEDIFIEALIAAAREHAEHITGRAFVAQTWEVALDSFPGNRIALPINPVMNVVSITAVGNDQQESTLNGSLYALNNYGVVHEVCLKPGQSWPAIASDAINPVKIRFVAGYGSNIDLVPKVVKQWILLRVAQAYKCREEYAENGFVSLPYVDRLLDAVRVPVL